MRFAIIIELFVVSQELTLIIIWSGIVMYIFLNWKVDPDVELGNDKSVGFFSGLIHGTSNLNIR